MLTATTLVLVTISKVFILLVAYPIGEITQKPELLDHENLKFLLQENRTEEAVELARDIHNKTKSSTSAFNLALILDNSGERAEALTITEELFKKWSSNESKWDDYEEGPETYNTEDVEISIWEKIFKEESSGKKEVPDLLSPRDKTTEIQVKKLLINLYLKLDKKTEMMTIIWKNPGIHQIMKALSVSNISYSLHIKGNEDNIKVYFKDDGIKEIKVESGSVDLSKLSTTVTKLILRRSAVVCSGGVDLPNLKDLFLYLMPVSFLSHLKAVPVSEIHFHEVPLVNISNLPPTIQKLDLSRVKEISANGETVLPNLKHLKLYSDKSFLSHFTSSPVTELDMRGTSEDLSQLPPTLQKLRMDKIKFIGNTEGLNLPNLNYLKTSEMSLPLSHFMEIPLKEIELIDPSNSVNLSHLPPTLQKLNLVYVEELSNSSADEGIPPNLTHLRLVEMPDTLPLFRSFPLTHLEIKSMKELNIDLIPQSIKNIKIIIPDTKDSSEEDDGRIIIIGDKQLDKLSLSGFNIEEAKGIMKSLHPKQLAISKDHNKFLPSMLISLMTNELNKIAVGVVNWGSLQKSEMSALTNDQGNTTSKYYLVENGKGSPIQEEQFDMLAEVY